MAISGRSTLVAELAAAATGTSDCGSLVSATETANGAEVCSMAVVGGEFRPPSTNQANAITTAMFPPATAEVIP